MKKLILIFLIALLNVLNSSAFGASEAELFYDSLTFESLTEQSRFSVTDSFSLPETEICTFSSSDEAVIKIEGNIAVVKRKIYRDSKAVLTAKISDGKTELEKNFNITVPAQKSVMGYNESFVYPMLEGEDITSSVNNTGWHFTRAPAEGGISGSFVKKDGLCALKISRGEANASDYALCEKAAEGECANKVHIALETMFEHDCLPQLYQLKIYGRYENSGISEKAQIAELQFHFTQSSNILVAYYYDEISKGLITKTAELSAVSGKWAEIIIEADTGNQLLSLSIDGKSVIEEIPFYETFNPEKNRENCAALDKITFNPYRMYGGGCIYINELVSFCEGGVSMDARLSKDGEQLTGIEQLDASVAQAGMLLYNFDSREKTVNALCCVYENGILTDIDLTEQRLLPNEKRKEIEFENIELTQNTENTVIKFLALDGSLYPYTEAKIFTNNLSQPVYPETIKDAETNREYYTVNLYGKNIFRSYFTMPIWSDDGRYFYFYDEDINYYEYDTQTNRVRFIDKGLYEYAITVKNDNIYYINKKREIIRMNVYERNKTVAGELPLWQTGTVTLLQINDAQTKLSLEWYDKSGEFNPEEKSRLPVLDLTTKEWDLSHVYGFGEDEENSTAWKRPNHMCINPKYDNLIFFAHEGIAVKDRIWVCDTLSDTYYNAYAQLDNEVVGHEIWSPDGERIFFVVTRTALAKGGIISIKYDGTDRICHNREYDYLHCAVSPDGRYVIADTIYVDNKSKLVLIDLKSGSAQVLATVVQTGEPATAHCHPCFSNDGKKIIFGTHSPDGTAVQLGWMDVSDIVERAE